MEDSQFIASELAILTRVKTSSTGNLPAPAAQAFLDMAFSQADIDRMNELAAKNRRGEVGDQVSEELEQYARVGNLINLLHSMARRSL